MENTEQKVVYETSETTHWKNLFKNKCMLLGAHNLNEGEELVAEIETVTSDEIKNNKGDKEIVAVVNFKGEFPAMVLNITNTRVIASLYGDLTENWVGKSIQIYATTVSGWGSTVNALRIREFIPQNGIDVSDYEDQLNACMTMGELKNAFCEMPKNIQGLVANLKDKRKKALGE